MDWFDVSGKPGLAKSGSGREVKAGGQIPGLPENNGRELLIGESVEGAGEAAGGGNDSGEYLVAGGLKATQEGWGDGAGQAGSDQERR